MIMKNCFLCLTFALLVVSPLAFRQETTCKLLDFNTYNSTCSYRSWSSCGDGCTRIDDYDYACIALNATWCLMTPNLPVQYKSVTFQNLSIHCACVYKEHGRKFTNNPLYNELGANVSCMYESRYMNDQHLFCSTIWISGAQKMNCLHVVLLTLTLLNFISHTKK